MTLHLAKLSARQVAFTNRVAAALTPLAFDTGKVSGTLHWQTASASFEPAIIADLDLDGVKATLDLDADPVGELLDLPVGGDELRRLPESFQACLLASMLEDLINRATSVFGFAIEATALRAPAPRSAPAAQSETIELCWLFIDDEERQRLAGRLHLLPQTADRIGRHFAGNGRYPRGLSTGQLPLDPLIVLGTTSLTRDEISTIRPGDVVLVRHHRWAESLASIIVAGELRYMVRADDGELTVVTQDDAEQESDFYDDQSDRTMIGDVDDLALPVSFDLGRLELTVGELGQVAEGYVFNLQRPLDSLVSVRANGRLIGRGQLVDIEGSLGVRVTEIFTPNNG